MTLPCRSGSGASGRLDARCTENPTDGRLVKALPPPAAGKLLVHNTTIDGNVDLSNLGRIARLKGKSKATDEELRLPGIRSTTDDLMLPQIESRTGAAVEALHVVEAEIELKEVVIRGDLVIGIHPAGKTDQIVSVFTQRVSLLDSVVCGVIQIYGARFLQGLDMRRSRLGRTVNFIEVLSGGAFVLTGAIVGERFEIRNRRVKGSGRPHMHFIECPRHRSSDGDRQQYDRQAVRYGRAK